MPKLDFGVTVSQGAAARFFNGDRVMKAAARARVRKEAQMVDEQLHARCPVDTGHMRKSIRTTYSSDRLAFASGWRRTDFEGVGLAFYPVFVVLGTSRMPARDFVTPVVRASRKRLRDGISKDVKAAIKRDQRRAGGGG